VLEITHRLEIKTFHSISGCKPHIISQFDKVELDLKFTSQ